VDKTVAALQAKIGALAARPPRGDVAARVLGSGVRRLLDDACALGARPCM